MANRFFSPNQQFVDSSGLPYAGGFLYFYASGTSTPLNTYSDSALTVANLNPIVLDSAGRAGSVFLQNLPYKVQLFDVNNVQIWTEDPVWSSDYSAYAQVQPIAGNPNGVLAGVAGTQGALPGSSMAWDYINDILYVATTTGNATTTVWTAVNATTATINTPAPQGYLTLNSDPSNPVLTSDAIASTSVFYTPFVGNLIPIFNSSSFAAQTFTQLSLPLTASQAANALYDVFVFNNSGVLTLVTGPAWSSSVAGSSSRGTGAGTTQIQRLNGLWVNQVQITGRNNATTYTIAANLATYLGTILISSSAGQVTCTVTYGASRQWGVWNAYNRRKITTKSGAAGSTPNQWAAGVTTNTIAGLAEEEYLATVLATMTGSTSASTNFSVGVGLNSTSALSGTSGEFSNPNVGAATLVAAPTAQYTSVPLLGLQTFNGLANAANAVATISSGELNNLLSVSWNG